MAPCCMVSAWAFCPRCARRTPSLLLPAHQVTERIRAIRDLKGGSVAVPSMGSTEQTFLSAMLAYVGVDPRRDVRWSIQPASTAIQLLVDGKIDGLLALPPVSQEVRARKIGHVVVNTAVDRPWSQYFCCMAMGHREFVKKNPVATKRALRALLKATDLSAREPERVARLITDKGIKSSPQKILAQGTDWRFLNELKKELKA